MTPVSAPGAAVTGAATPRAPAGLPGPMMGSYSNLAAAVRVAPRPPPRAQAPPGIPIARPRMPFPPHAQGAPIPGVPRPVSAPSPTPRMQAVPPQPARAPGIPPNARPHMTLSQPTQRTPAVAVPSLGKRDGTTMGPAAPSQQHAKRQAPMQQRPQGAPPMGSVSLPAAPTVGVRSPVPPGLAQGTPTPSGAPQPPQQRKTGVRNDPSKGWMARVIDPRRRVARDIGPFADGLQAALAHDRVAIACGADQRLLLPTAFYHAETAFLQRWEGDICDAVEKGTYEKSYARFLVAGFKAALRVMVGDDDGEQITDEGDALIAKCVGDGDVLWGDIEEFFLDRAEEIGEEALKLKDDGKLLRIRFVEMHRNKALCPEWRHNHRIQMQQQQQQMCGGNSAKM